MFLSLEMHGHNDTKLNDDNTTVIKSVYTKNWLVHIVHFDNLIISA